MMKITVYKQNKQQQKKQRKNKRNYAFIVKAIWAFIRLEIFSFSYFIKFFVELFSWDFIFEYDNPKQKKYNRKGKKKWNGRSKNAKEN